jgi:hypothetical protein
MNSASRGLWPVVGLRRPGKAPFASAEADAWRASALRRPISIGVKGLRPVGRLRRPGKPAPTFCVGGGRRLARLAWRPISIGAEGLRPVGLRRPGEDPFASAEADAWRAAPGEADFNRRQRPSAGESPAPTWKSTFCVGGGRRPARSALRGRFQSAPGWRSGLPLLPAPVIESRFLETADRR